MYYCSECESLVGLEKEFCGKCSAELMDREEYIRTVEERKKKIERGTRRKFIISIILGVVLGFIFLIALMLILPPPLIAGAMVIWILCCWGICLSIRNKGRSKLVKADRGIAYRKAVVPTVSTVSTVPPVFEEALETKPEVVEAVSVTPEVPSSGSKLKMAKNLYKTELPKDSINFYEYLQKNAETVWKCNHCDTENSINDMYCIVCGSQKE